MSDGKTLAWSPKQRSREYATFQLPCGKCIECRLDYARQWAVRCVHESRVHEKNCFVTLTYSDENLVSQKLNYIDFQEFIKRLRSHIFRESLKPLGGEAYYAQLSKSEKRTFRENHSSILDGSQISVFVTGEYGDRTKRPHWHACIFNWAPSDSTYKYSNERGDKVFESATLSQLWGKGIAEYGSVTFQSAGYCARYAAKKLVHGNDGEHDFEPVSKKSSKHAIGKRWLERYWEDVFNHGQIVLPDGSTCGIPRYYEKWLQKTHPEEWTRYVTERKILLCQRAKERQDRENNEHADAERKRQSSTPLTSRKKAQKIVTEAKLNLHKNKNRENEV